MSSKTMTEFHETLTDAAAKAPTSARQHEAMKVGAVAHQGDVYIHRIKAKPEAWSTETTAESRQIALGATVGSRHCADGPVRVFWPKSREESVKHCPVKGFFARLRGVDPSPCIGPVVVADGEWTLTHPEHAHHVMPAGVYFVSYQLDMRTLRAVRD